MPPSSNHPIQALHQFREVHSQTAPLRLLPDLGTHPPPRLPTRPGRRDAPPGPLRRLLVDMAPEDVNAVLDHPDDAGLVWMEPQRQPRQETTADLPRLWRLLPRTADDPAISGGAIEPAHPRRPLLPPTIPHVPVDVGEPGTEHSPLRRACCGGLPPSSLDNPHGQPLAEEFQPPPIADPSLHQSEPLPVVDGVKERLHVGLQDPPSAHPRRLPRPDRVPGVPLRAEPLGAVPNAGLTPRCSHERARRLDPPVAPRREAQRALPTVRLRQVHPSHRLRALPPRLPVHRPLVKAALDPAALDILEADPVDARTPPLRAHCFPGPPHHVGPDEAVIPRVDPAVPTPLGRQIQSALAWSSLVLWVWLALARLHRHVPPRETRLQQGPFPPLR